MNGAKWLACGAEFQSPIILKYFDLLRPGHAVIKICGLGYYELFVNGRRVGDDYFKPAASDYSPRTFEHFLYPLPDETSHTVYYNEYDLSPYLVSGKNTLAVMLGNGFYRQNRRNVEGNTVFSDRLVAAFSVDLGDKKIISDGSERYIDGFVKDNNLFYGETQDYDCFDEEVFVGKKPLKSHKVEVVLPPQAEILAQKCPFDKVKKTITPKLVGERGKRKIYDLGENIAGFVALVPECAEVTVTHAENLTADGELDYFSAGSADQISACTYKNAAGRRVHPWFCWSGFRYFSVEGEARDIRAEVVTADVPVTASFDSDTPVLNWLFDAYIRTQLNNMHGGVTSDCPHRERLGYTGDGQLIAESCMLMTGSKRFFEKWMRDIADCQDTKSGHVQHTAPMMGGGGGPGGWGGAMVLVPYAYYKIYGDAEGVRPYLPNIVRFLDCMESFTEGGIVVREREKGWCLGDWCTPEPVALPEPFVNTFYYILAMKRAEELASALGVRLDYSEKIARSMAAMEKNYFDGVGYLGGVQGADAFALQIGLGNKTTAKRLVEKYKNLRYFDTGIFGTEVLTDYLAKEGEAQLLYDLLSSEAQNHSFGHMMRSGATTLWEDFAGSNSHDHPMFGACTRQLFYGLLGITLGEKITVAPRYIVGPKYLRGTLNYRGGTLTVSLVYDGGTTRAEIKESGLDVHLLTPAGELKVNGSLSADIPNSEIPRG